ncbi:MAG: carbon-nitrogen hydrolase family protein [Actinomycetota bacterium]|nr:carbon-nitrogen hydrolase family protein [Actinomycetota bacterium]
MPHRRVASAQAIAAVSGQFGRDVEACLTEIEVVVRQARRRGARLIVFPESTLGGYLGEGPGVQPTAIVPPPLPGHAEAFERLIRMAGDAVLCVGYTEAAPGGPFSSAVCLSGDGVLGHHRKVHIPAGEQGLISAGDGFAAFDTPVGRLGMLTCYDKVFPEAARALTLDGAEIVACMAAWPVCRAHPARLVRNDRQVRHFNALDVARAVENQVVWVSSNQYGSLGALRFPGQAKVVDPDGRVLASTGARAGIALARVDTRGAIDSARAQFFHLADRIPEAYAVSLARRVA